MTDGSVAYYPLLDDDGATLERVISVLPEEHRRAMTRRPTEDWLLEVSPRLADALSCLFDHMGVRHPDPSWKPGAVLVPDGIRTAVEDVLKAAGRSGRWSQVEGVEFATEHSRRAFEAAL